MDILKDSDLRVVYKSKLIKVVDGDTIYLHVNLGLGFFCNALVRLVGLEGGEIFGVKKGSEEFKKGQVSKLYVKKWFMENGNDVYLSAEHRGYHGRWLGIVWAKVGEKSLNDYLLDAGVALKKEKWYCQEPLLKDAWNYGSI